MTGQEAIEYIHSYNWEKRAPGLQRIRELLRKLGDPQKDLKFVHVAGTNGKGSTCILTERILREAGYRTGFYPSPEIETFTERIRVNGEYIPEEDLVRITESVAKEADAMDDHPTQFELITAIGIVYFLEKKCDFVVLEVGMGGAMDSTNVIDAPEVAVLTNIGLDHTDYLGSTIAEIAATKCGIIKPGCSVVSYDSVPEAMEVIRSVCAEKGVRLYESPHVLTDAGDGGTGEDGILSLSRSLDGQKFRFRGREYILSLLGNHQLRNAAAAITVIDALRDRGFAVSDDAVREGLSKTEWPVRFEVLSRDPLFILDGGHNPQCAAALAENIEAYLIPEYAEGGDKEVLTYLIGMLADKDYRQTLDILKPYGENYICITPDSPRALPAQQMAETIREMVNDETFAGRIEYYEKKEEAVKAAVDAGCPVVAFGSLYSAGEIRKIVRG